MNKCLIIQKEITVETCEQICKESYKDKAENLPKKFKRVVGWKMICKTCKYHKK